MTDLQTLVVDDLPRDPGHGHRPLAWWGTWLFIATEAMLFAGLISSYFYLRFGAEQWPLGDIEPPELMLAGVGTALLVTSSATAHWAERSIAAGRVRGLQWGLAATMALGVGFLGIQAYEYMHSTFTPATNAYGSIFFAVTGFHGLHLLGGVGMLLAVAVASWRGEYDRHHHLPVRLSIIYWHFVDAVWLVVFSALYLSEHLA
ncbi:MAG: heme-copper oxidase subunit III [Actinomycetota bacterium]